MNLAAAALLLAAAAPAGAATQQVYGGALQALPLYGRLATAREAALGDAFHSAAIGEDALFANPAGLSSLTGASLGLHHESWLGGIDEESLSVSDRVAQGLGAGAYGVLVNYGSFDLRDAQGLKTGDAVVQDYAVGLGLGMASAYGFSGGLGLRAVRQDLVTDAVDGLGVDTGFNWCSPEGWVAGLSALGLRLMDGSAGGTGVRAALARRWVTDEGWVWPCLAMDWEPNGLSRAQGGLELRLNPALDLRAGFEQPVGDRLLDGLRSLTLGLGCRVGPIAVDYAYLPQGDLGSGHRLSLSWRQGQTDASPPDWKPVAPAVQAPPRPVATPAPTPPPLPSGPPALPPSAPAPLALSAGAQVGLSEDPLGWARQLEDEGRQGEALAEYEKEAALHPELEGAWRGVADLSYRLGAKAKAVQAYHRLLRLRPDDALAAWLRDYEQAPDNADK